MAMRRSKKVVAPRKPSKGAASTELNVHFNEEPLLLDDPGGSPLEWLEFSSPYLHEAVRHQSSCDPWSHPGFASENDALTERRRRKLQNISLHCEDDLWDEKGESVA